MMFQKLKQFFTKKRTRVPNYEFTDDDRRLAKELRQIKQQKKLIEQRIEVARAQAELDDVMAELAEYEEDDEEDQLNPMDFANNPDMMFMQLLSKLVDKNQTPHQPTQQGTPETQAPPASGARLSDEEIRAFVAEKLTSEDKTVLKMQGKEKTKSLIMQHYPNYDDDTYNRTVQVIYEN
jgi:hypothetical protein